ncbi:MAG TPA: PaaX family transcriptional regulator C-terminal domain-containing protein [Verrucomicrobiota bacterium]|nr:PaaX family transcriptional regulator C-terminal domain-containing protein [Verrucomicrobiota bacterium]
MQPKTEEFLYFLLWSAEQLMRPTFRNLTESYESWAYRNGLFRQVAVLERRQLLETNAEDDRLCRLTEQGRLHALGGRDPEVRWSRPWDGQWRLVLFDVSIQDNARRERLRRYLRDRDFGCVQGSVWITPDSISGEREILAGGKVNVESLLLLEARPGAGETDSEIVNGAWDFERINQRYARLLKVFDECPVGRLSNFTAAKALQRWAADERQAWLEAVTGDPLLPACLLPTSYLGRQVWRRRKEVLRQAGQQLRRFRS